MKNPFNTILANIVALFVENRGRWNRERGTSASEWNTIWSRMLCIERLTYTPIALNIASFTLHCRLPTYNTVTYAIVRLFLSVIRWPVRSPPWYLFGTRIYAVPCYCIHTKVLEAQCPTPWCLLCMFAITAGSVTNINIGIGKQQPAAAAAAVQAPAPAP